MMIFREKEVNIEKILERFERKKYCIFGEIKLNPLNNENEKNLEDKIKILPNKWKQIIPKVREKYNKKYDLILVSAYILDINSRVVEITCGLYNLK